MFSTFTSMPFAMKFLATALGFATAASAHTLFTTFYVDGENQGDGTCVREPTDASKGNFPVYPLNGDDMACGMCFPSSACT